MTKSLEITVSAACKINCSFCPQSVLAKAYKSDKKWFTMEDFALCLTTVPKDVRCDWSGFVEPLLHPRAPEMMKLARLAGHDTHLYSTLMGLKGEGLQDLIDSRPGHIRVHIPEAIGMPLQPFPWLKQLDLFLSTGLKATYMAMSRKIHPHLVPELAKRGIVVELPAMLSRGGNLTNVESPNFKGPIRCAMERWTQNILMPDGNVYGCCQDFGLTVPLGNLLRQPYTEIAVAAQEWRKNMERDATGTICSRCSWAIQA